jgi:hypothetical protein
MCTDVSPESAHCAATESASDPIVLQMTAGASYGREGSWKRLITNGTPARLLWAQKPSC